ncbi:L-glutamine-D-fructose-6-phosphate aminotransferase [Providencia phage PSTCR4]|uniref:7-cyano-7-deazaguanine synthase n=1 Tax=Providencia phage PSTCR4 TaxID=2783546 RepID=A0A873WKS4_9CAUD|nr:L-glutamine-D-fructose-6-phosphate aminotransferase [Providencia phage PSTCR4]QPB12066.1 archaeosine synthase, glutamine amidotransferases type / 7-cyano-7-deazaguanine synthase [Providencia phage PSTCR4]
MCGIFGFMVNNPNKLNNYIVKSSVLKTLVNTSLNRGRDGIGASGLSICGQTGSFRTVELENTSVIKDICHNLLPYTSILIGNTRAEPTTEYVKEKQYFDQQPYKQGKWTIVHNGTIANDKEIADEIKKHSDTPLLQTSIDSARIADLLNYLTADYKEPLTMTDASEIFNVAVKKLKGSFAILAFYDDLPEYLFTACNYKPLYITEHMGGCSFSSEPIETKSIAMDTYGTNVFTNVGGKCRQIDHVNLKNQLFATTDSKALVVCSGGLDSTVVASKLVAEGYNVTLMHFQYGCKAETKELQCVQAIAENLGVNVVIKNIPFYDTEDSVLLNDSAIAVSEAGAEFAHEWVPARNLLMLSIATAYAEAKGYNFIALGNNLEESGAYPDNEPEFIRRFNHMLPFAVGDGVQLKVIMPVGNLMKHEIVALGLKVNAPMQLTWSCYEQGEHHCGKCGPCFMRKTAFEINGKVDPVMEIKND